jgi:ASC-1-like (ASCH) protein
MGLAEHDFQKVEAGTKTLELRLFNKKRATIKIGDFIRFESRGNVPRKVTCEVRSIHLGKTFDDLFRTQLDPKHAGFESAARTIEAVRRFYTEEDEKTAGVICFGIKLTKTK